MEQGDLGWCLNSMRGAQEATLYTSKPAKPHTSLPPASVGEGGEPKARLNCGTSRALEPHISATKERVQKVLCSPRLLAERGMAAGFSRSWKP